ncbi:transcription initiation factor IIB [Halomarina ordinaria]|uniref:Transcription initiation factor IIB n=1 Tax=Halomarina ordinaria TaxID=3033939 RepID=A0ABD5UDA1_9EURY|nr:TFIIB-type zinc ribbon-containing protein [Halomarina sp. PSRA2]
MNRDDGTERHRAGEHEAEACPECGGRLVADAERGERACTECGLVVEEGSIDRGPEWRAFDSAERDQKSRVGAPTSEMMHDKGLSTNIDWQNRDANGNALSSRQRQKMQRLRTWNERFRTRDSKERNLKQALGEIDRMASALGLPENVRETASVIYRRALDAGLLPGRSIEGVATGALYAASRLAGVPRSTGDLAAVSRVERLEFERTYRYLLRELELGVPPADPSDYLPRVASDVGVSNETEQTARRVLAAGIDEGVHVGKTPVGLAAAAVYAAGLLTGAELTQADITDVVDVSAVTIRNRYRELLEAAHEHGVA